MRRVLYVEDNDDNVYMLKLRFDALDGFEFLTAADGEAGYAKARTELPDVILMDLDLPVIDGWEVTRRLKQDVATRDIPIIALTAHAMAGSREKAIAAGCDEFDTKPINFDRLMQRTEKLVQNLVAKGQTGKVRGTIERIYYQAAAMEDDDWREFYCKEIESRFKTHMYRLKFNVKDLIGKGKSGGKDAYGRE